jgi:hypothetical protein
MKYNKLLSSFWTSFHQVYQRAGSIQNTEKMTMSLGLIFFQFIRTIHQLLVARLSESGEWYLFPLALDYFDSPIMIFYD